MNPVQKEAVELSRDAIKYLAAPVPQFGLVDLEKCGCVCGKRPKFSEMEILDTGVLQVVNNVCKDCKSGQKHDRELARIVCCRCKQVVSRIAPHKDTDGFVFGRNHTYHVDKCGVCEPGLTESPIIEKLIYQRKLKKDNIL